jgi:hypothetical protein
VQRINIDVMLPPYLSRLTKNLYMIRTLIVAGLCVALSSFWFIDLNELPINKIQVIGSHNSYKQSIDPPLFSIIKKSDSSLARHIEYSHISITDQLNLGVLNLEIDIYADSKGGKYAHPKGLELEKTANNILPYDPSGVMKERGFKVFHIQDLDFRSHCLTFRKCLQDLKKWSEEHNDHYPVFITMNAKDDTIKKPGYSIPEKFTSAVYDQLDSTIIKDLGRENILTPDEVRGNYKTLEEAVLKGNWPQLKNAKGKFIFILDEKGDKVKSYVKGHTALNNRVLFVNAKPGSPEAAILIMNDAIKDQQAIQDLVSKGYIVRTRADADTEEARRNDKSRFNAACTSGAQIITTDYYAKSTHFPSEYVISFDDGKYVRENPVVRP